MINLTQSGTYKLIETRGNTKILILDGKTTFAWVHVNEIGEILVTTHKIHKVDHILSIGEYRIYDIKDEINYSDQLHLELSVGAGQWQGYLLLTGLPTDKKKRNRIVPTKEVVTESIE